MNRNHYMTLGTVLLLLGLAVFKIEKVTLNEDSTRLLAQQTETQPEQGLLASTMPAKKTIAIPPTVRFLCISVGAILMLHAIGMQKPG
jgi:hypothetical protein